MLHLATSHLPRSLTRGTWIEDGNPGPGGVYARLEELGHELSGFTERVVVGRATEDEARMFALTLGHPVLRVTRIAYSHDRPVEATLTVMSSDRYELVYDLPAT